jgi:ABC-type lipoprotein release transport system permease subunit
MGSEPPADVGVFAAAALTMLLVSIVATTVPARRALGIAPLEAIRES